MDKKCCKCKKKKSINAFAFRNIQKGKRQFCCRDCHKKSRRKYYLENKEVIKHQVYKRKRKLSKRLKEYKDGKRCKDCNIGYPCYVLDFNHLRDKKNNVSKLVSNGFPWIIIMKEIKKCDLICSNCHRMRTHSKRV